MVFDSIMFSYGARKILNGIYLKIPKGEIVGLFGLNGSGKTTLIKIGCGHLKADNGNIFINNESDFGKTLVNRFQKIAYLSQNNFLPSDLTIKNIVKRNRFRERIFTEDVLISRLYNQKVSSLSGGELRFLEVKLLLSLNREYYLLDEPFSGIEPKIIEKIMALLLEAKSARKGILITDHFYRYVKEINDISFVLKDGICHEINNSNIDKELSNFGYIL